MSPDASIFSPIAVVIPAFNAAKVVESTLDDIFRWIDAQGAGVDARVLVVDDGSSDLTSEIVRRYPRHVTLVRNDGNRGKGYSVKRGVLSALQDDPLMAPSSWVLFMDVDNSTPIHHLNRFAQAYLQHRRSDSSAPEILIGSRRTDGAVIVKRQHALRQILGKSFPYIVRTLALPDIRDTQCGFKLLHADAARRIFPHLRIDRFAFDVEILMLACRLNYTICEVPVDWENPTASTLRIARDAPKMLIDVFSAAWRLRGSGPVMRSIRDPSSRARES